MTEPAKPSLMPLCPKNGKKVSRQAPDLKKIKAARQWQSESYFGVGVLELCQTADIVFLALHGSCGEDGRVQATLEAFGIPFTGANYLSSAIAMDKDLTKRLVAPLGIHTPQWQRVTYTQGDIPTLVNDTALPCGGQTPHGRLLHRRLHRSHSGGADGGVGAVPGHGQQHGGAGAVCVRSGDPGRVPGGSGAALHRDHPQERVL